MSRASESDCSMDDQLDDREVLDEEENMALWAPHTPGEEEEPTARGFLLT